VLDDLDKELARRGHRFCRYADDCNIYVRSRRAGERVIFLGGLAGLDPAARQIPFTSVILALGAAQQEHAALGAAHKHEGGGDWPIGAAAKSCRFAVRDHLRHRLRRIGKLSSANRKRKEGR
jgi:hypothetical protein